MFPCFSCLDLSGNRFAEAVAFVTAERARLGLRGPFDGVKFGNGIKFYVTDQSNHYLLLFKFRVSKNLERSNLDSDTLRPGFKSRFCPNGIYII